LDLRADKIEVHVYRPLIVELQHSCLPFGLQVACVAFGALCLHNGLLPSGTRGHDKHGCERKAANYKRH
jgi:hypothetical protein